MICYSNGFVCLQYIQYTRHNIVWWQKMMRLRKQKIIGRYHLFSNTHNDDKRAFCICWGCPFLTFVKYFINEDIFLASILLLYLLFDNNHFLLNILQTFVAKEHLILFRWSLSMISYTTLSFIFIAF